MKQNQVINEKITIKENNRVLSCCLVLFGGNIRRLSFEESIWFYSHSVKGLDNSARSVKLISERYFVTEMIVGHHTLYGY